MPAFGPRVNERAIAYVDQFEWIYDFFFSNDANTITTGMHCNQDQANERKKTKMRNTYADSEIWRGKNSQQWKGNVLIENRTRTTQAVSNRERRATYEIEEQQQKMSLLYIES